MNRELNRFFVKNLVIALITQARFFMIHFSFWFIYLSDNGVFKENSVSKIFKIPTQSDVFGLSEVQSIWANEVSRKARVRRCAATSKSAHQSQEVQGD